MESVCVEAILTQKENDKALKVTKETIFGAIYQKIVIHYIRKTYVELCKIPQKEIKPEFYLVQQLLRSLDVILGAQIIDLNQKLF